MSIEIQTTFNFDDDMCIMIWFDRAFESVQGYPIQCSSELLTNNSNALNQSIDCTMELTYIIIRNLKNLPLQDDIIDLQIYGLTMPTAGSYYLTVAVALPDFSVVGWDDDF